MTKSTKAPKKPAPKKPAKKLVEKAQPLTDEQLDGVGGGMRTSGATFTHRVDGFRDTD